MKPISTSEEERDRERRSEVSPDEAWAAVLARDPLADGRFVYAVATTRIYCRPVCPSRRPLRENVEFFPGPAEAEAAGYRPCRRCRPRRARGDDPAARCVERARAYLEEHLDENVPLEALGRVAYMSPFHLQRSFKRLLGVSPREYVRARRSERLKERLRAGDTVSRATYAAGFGSGSRVYERADAELGMTPGAYRRGGKGERIRYAVVPCSLGRLLVGATDRGICAIALGDEPRELEEGLRREFPHAALEPADDLGEWVEAVLRLVEGLEPGTELPLDVRATAFQNRVWKALREIPPGETRSYGEIAALVGVPGGARAMARACASNRLALAIPCHRVVRGSGEPGGYRWGVERKRALLSRERALATPGRAPAPER